MADGSIQKTPTCLPPPDSLFEAEAKAKRKVQAEQRARRERAAAAKKGASSSLFGDDDDDGTDQSAATAV